MEIKMKTAWVFDFDDTLVFTDAKVNKSHLFMRVSIKEVDNDMLRFLVILKNRDEKVFILTGRHPDLREKLAKYFDLKLNNIICRNHDLSKWKINLATSSPAGEKEFLKTLTDFKISILNKLASKFDLVLYFDDMFRKFLDRGDIDRNVVVLPPSGYARMKINEAIKRVKKGDRIGKD